MARTRPHHPHALSAPSFLPPPTLHRPKPRPTYVGSANQQQQHRRRSAWPWPRRRLVRDSGTSAGANGRRGMGTVRSFRARRWVTRGHASGGCGGWCSEWLTGLGTNVRRIGGWGRFAAGRESRDKNSFDAVFLLVLAHLSIFHGCLHACMIAFLVHIDLFTAEKNKSTFAVVLILARRKHRPIFAQATPRSLHRRVSLYVLAWHSLDKMVR